MGEVILDAFLDTLKVLPFLLVMNFLIEFIEYRSKGLKADKILKGGFAPLIGTAVGIVPQCGFSVVATELYGKRKIALGTLVAVYIATSDEALPILLSSYDGLLKVLPVLLIKIVFSLVAGYAVFGAEKLAARSRAKLAAQNIAVENADGVEEHEHEEPANDEHTVDELDHAEHEEHCADEPDHAEHEEHEHDGHVHITGCHHHELGESELPENADKKQKAAWVWRTFLKHPLIHTGTVILFIFLVNIAFGVAIYYVGEERIAAFMSKTGYLQPVFAALVGLIPNCAGSVVITEMYVVGGLNLGGAAAGLCVSAGIGYAVLVRENRPVKNTVLIIALMYIMSVALGVAITACGF